MTTDTILLLIGGLVSAGFGAFATFSPTFATRYVQTSPKAWIWRKMLGPDRAVVAVQRVFGPLGIVLGIIMLYFAITIMRASA